MSSEVTQELRIALFGQSGSGKTTFLSSFYGNQQLNSFQRSRGYFLEADNISVGNQLLSRFHQMEDGNFPLGTEDFSEFKFNFKITGIPKPGLQIIWYDYPGGWWEREPSDSSEEKIRNEALLKILNSHVGIIMVDGQKYMEKGKSYIKPLLEGFKFQISKLKASIPASDEELKLPKQWITAITKADLLPKEKTARVIGNEIVRDAADQLLGIADVIGSKEFGHQFLLISSAVGEEGKVVDAGKFVGLQLVAPLALESILIDLADKMPKGEKYGLAMKTFIYLANLADFFDKLDDFLPKKFQILSVLLNTLSAKENLDKGAEFFKRKQLDAAKNGKLTEAVAAAMSAELAATDAQHAFYRNQ